MKEITALEFENEVIKGGKVVLDFYSTECPPCETLAPKFEGLADGTIAAISIAKELN